MIRHGREEWITNVLEMTMEYNISRQEGGGLWEEIVGRGAREYAKNRGMVGMLGDISHPEEGGGALATGEYCDSVSGVPLHPQLVQQARRE